MLHQGFKYTSELKKMYELSENNIEWNSTDTTYSTLSLFPSTSTIGM